MLLGDRLQADGAAGTMRLALLHPALLDASSARLRHLVAVLGEASLYRNCATPPPLGAQEGRVQLVTERDMLDAKVLCDLTGLDHEWIHDVAQIIADGRRPSAAKANYIKRVIASR